MITAVQLILISNISVPLAEQWIDALNTTCDQYNINTCLRQAAFISQILVESGSFRYVREIWGPTQAQLSYEGRADLGNIYQGDGKRFRGRGLIQITGRNNYQACGQALGLDLTNQPQLLEQPEYAMASAGWYWDSNNINTIADNDDIVGVTRAVNGGLNGYDQRLHFYTEAQKQLFC